MQVVYDTINQGINNIKDLLISSTEQYNIPIVDCFPAVAILPVIINNKEYSIEVTVDLTEV